MPITATDPTGHTRTLSVFVYGSCVTRDGVELGWKSRGLELTGYVARQSLISAMSPADTRKFRTDSIASAFQRRMAEGDIRGNLLASLRQRTGSLDAVIWDLTDERLGVAQVPSGGYVTLVVNYNKGIYRDAKPLSAPVKLGQPKHWELWRRAADDFLHRLDAFGLLERTVVNATPWAVADSNGVPTSYPAIAPAEFNDTITRYYEYLSQAGISVVEPTDEAVTADPGHKWGSAPFHYIDAAYTSFLDNAFPGRAGQ